MVVWPGEVLNSSLYLVIAVAGAFGAKLKYTPIVIVSRSDEGDEARKGIAVRARRIRDCWAGRDYYCRNVSYKDSSTAVMGAILSSVR